MQNLRSSAAAFVLALPFAGWAQPRASACFFNEDFEGENALAGWDLGTQVERRTPEGVGLGEFVAAWTLGDAADANAAQYFPVTDSPIGNRFVMANDAAPPCNCGMDDVLLTTPTIDLTGRTGVALECRVFNEGTLGAGNPRIEANVEGDTWNTVQDIAAVEGDWQHLVVDLSAYDNSSALRLRFRWSDGGNWASGFALDDVCLRTRQVNDVSVNRVLIGDATVSPFTIGDQSLQYRQLPLTQAGPVHITAEVKNSGTAMLRNIQVDAMLELNGTGQGSFLAALIDSLMPGATTYAPIATNWTPTEAGTLTFTANAVHGAVDDDSSDDSVSGEIQLTTPGWDGGYSAMSCDAGIATGSVGGTGTFMVANRMEIINSGDHANGISVSFNPALTQVGEVVRATLMDANFSFIDTSMRRTLSQADIDGMWNGVPQYFNLSTAPELSAGDYWVAIQHLNASAQNVHVNVGGASPLGRSAILEGTGFTLSYLYSTPMVRLHLSEVAVAVHDIAGAEGLVSLYPLPANDEVQVVIPPAFPTGGSWHVVDASGRTVLSGRATASSTSGRLVLRTADLVEGYYTLVLVGGDRLLKARLVVAH